MGKTYFIDIDGTLTHHLTIEQLNYILNNKQYEEKLLPGVKELWNTFTDDDYIIITTGRRTVHKELTEKIFKENNLRYNQLIMDLPCGPRYLINDTPDILFKKAIAINVKRDGGFFFDKTAENEK